MCSKRIIACLCSFTMVLSVVSFPFSVYAFSWEDLFEGIYDAVLWRFQNKTTEFEAPGIEFSVFDGGPSVTLTGKKWTSSIPQNYYTTPTESIEDENGNVTNYYRGGDTTTTQILDSYNQTFSTIHNVSNTNDYEANIALENFLNSYTTNTSNYTYNMDYKSWYYDNTSNTVNYDASQTYYNNSWSEYFITIDNSTDEYYLVDIQYSPTFVTVNYTYNNIDNSVQHGNVTNVYYFELKDGRNSSTLTADDVLGLDLGYDVTNYELITDDDNTLSLQHFDGDYSDSSTYANNFYSENRSTTYVDSGDFGKAVKLAKGAAAGVSIPKLSGKDGLTFDFRIYYDKIDSLGVYLGSTGLFEALPEYRQGKFYDYYSDHDIEHSIWAYEDDYVLDSEYTSEEVLYSENVSTFSSVHKTPTKGSQLDDLVMSSKYGYAGTFATPIHVKDTEVDRWVADRKEKADSSYDPNYFDWTFTHTHYLEHSYLSTTRGKVAADFAYSSYANQWISMRITILDGFIWYFVNGDLVGSGGFTMPSADKFYIKSSGTLYLDELRITTGDMVYTSSYVPSNAPYDTNKVLALPSTQVEDMIYVRSSTPVTAWRVGGVRPSNPSKGFFYIPIYSDNTGGQSQIYDGNNWINVDSVIYNGSTTVSTKGFTFSPVGDSVDINTDNSSGSGSDSDDPDEPSTSCTHEWVLTETVDGEYDLYTCSKCAKQHYDYDQSGSPPSSDSGSDSGSSGSSSSFLKWLGEKLGELIGAIADGFIALLESTLGVVLDSLISLVTTTVDKLSQVVNLFGSFGNSLGALWSWMPPEIQFVITLGVTLFVFIAVIRFFFK